MHFRKSSRVACPADVVLDIMMNRLHEVVPFMPNVDRIDLLERQDLPDGRVRIIRRWQGSVDILPAALRPFIPTEALSWVDSALWAPAEHKVDWTFTAGFSRLYQCSGTNYFEPDPRDPRGSTCIRLTGSLEIYPERLPGVPKLLAASLKPRVERFVVGLLTPSLTETAAGLQKYLEARKSG